MNQKAPDNLFQKFFKTIESDEFGMSRLIADPLNNIPKMLENFTPPALVSKGVYAIQAECENSLGDEIRLEYRFRALSQEGATIQAEEYLRRLVGRQKKIYEACWALANKRQSRIITCDLTEIMLIAYPEREGKNSFSVDKRLEFYQDLVDLSHTQLTLKKAQNSTNPARKKNKINTFLLPFITIFETSEYNMASSEISGRYPNSISFSILHNPLYEREAMYNVGAGIKHKTLELRPEDTALAEWIQIRKSQRKGEKNITFTDRESLFKLANLSGIKHVGMANKKLLDKFGRLKEKGIISSYPERIKFPFVVEFLGVNQPKRLPKPA